MCDVCFLTMILLHDDKGRNKKKTNEISTFVPTIGNFYIQADELLDQLQIHRNADLMEERAQRMNQVHHSLCVHLQQHVHFLGR